MIIPSSQMKVDLIDRDGDRRQGLKQMQPIAGYGERRVDYVFSGGLKTLNALGETPARKVYIYSK